jgi:hypothetical protein
MSKPVDSRPETPFKPKSWDIDDIVGDSTGGRLCEPLSASEPLSTTKITAVVPPVDTVRQTTGEGPREFFSDIDEAFFRAHPQGHR